MGWDTWNMVSTIGAFVIMVGFLVFAVNWLISVRNGDPAGDDPWDARTLEWSITSPPPPHNFDVVPIVEARDDWWHAKYTEDEEGRMLRRISGAADDDPAAAPVEGGVATLEKSDGGDDHGDGPHSHGDGHGEHIHMPSPSYHPIVVALGIPLVGYGFIHHWAWFIPGGLLTLFGLLGWAMEPDSE